MSDSVARRLQTLPWFFISLKVKSLWQLIKPSYPNLRISRSHLLLSPPCSLPSGYPGLSLFCAWVFVSQIIGTSAVSPFFRSLPTSHHFNGIWFTVLPLNEGTPSLCPCCSPSFFIFLTGNVPVTYLRYWHQLDRTCIGRVKAHQLLTRWRLLQWRVLQNGGNMGNLTYEMKGLEMIFEQFWTHNCKCSRYTRDGSNYTQLLPISAQSSMTFKTYLRTPVTSHYFLQSSYP